MIVVRLRNFFRFNKRHQTGRRRVRRVIQLLPVLLIAAGIAYAAAPPANTSIGNQASATYTDASNTQRTVTSNTVVTIVQQVASFTLTTDGQSKSAAPGGQVVFPHTLTNTGNGNDNFNLSVVANGGGSFTLSNVTLYADLNGDGIPDNSTAITSTGTLAAGAAFKFVAVGIVPVGQTAGQTSSLTATAVGTATGTPAAAQNNTDNVTVTSDAVINVTKSMSAQTGAAGSGPYTVTLSYTNTGNNTAVNFTLTDVIPAGMVYLPASGRWSITGSGVTLTDAADGAQGTAPDTITYDYGQTVAGRVTAVISRVQPGESRTLTFNVNIQAGWAAGIISNTANFSYDPGTGTPTTTYPTNTVNFRVTPATGVTITGQTIASATQGATVSFTNVVTNTANATDSFDITYSNVSFPVGTTFQLFKSDGVTPLVDTNGNSIPDTGPLAVGATYNVILQAVLPPGSSGNNVNYTVNKIATSFNDSSTTANANDILTTVTANTVDLTNNVSISGGANAAQGLGIGPEATARVTNSINAGATTRFTLFVNNTGAAADSYDLSASNVSSFATGLPAGWTVVFSDTGGTVLTNTGAIPGGGNKQINADVSVPFGTVPTTYSVYFRALSPTSGSLDRIFDAITINQQRSIVIAPNGSSQVVAGGTVVFPHTITNTGNTLEGDGVVSNTAITLNNSVAGWTTILYFDANNNGIIDPTENPITNLNFVSNGSAGLAAGESIHVLLKVTSPPGAPVGQIDTVTISATTTNGTYTSTAPAVAVATDSIAVVGSNVQMLKEQALDGNNDGTPDTAYGTTDITTGALPGKSIRYRITVVNTGASPVDNVKVYDSTPAYTTYTSTNAAAVSGGSSPSVATVPANGATGSFQFNVGTLNPGQQATVTFGVKIDQ